MFRHPLLLILLAGSASAQTLAPALVSPDSARAVAVLPAHFTAADTIQAIHRIYTKHRRVGSLLTVGALAADLTAAGVSAAAEGAPKSSGGAYGWNPGGISFGFGGYAVIYGILAAPVMGVGIQQLIAFGPKREAKVIARYEATGKLPAKISWRLRKNLR